MRTARAGSKFLECFSVMETLMLRGAEEQGCTGRADPTWCDVRTKIC